jgi:hypothetical protein
MFCHKEWKERVKYTTIAESHKTELLDSNSLSEREVDFYMPCQFQNINN